MTRRRQLSWTGGLSVVLALLGCGSDDAGGAVGAAGSGGAAGAGGAAGGAGAGASSGSAGARATLKVATWGTNLFGADADYENERRPAILAALAADDADVLCVTDVVREEDKQAIADAAKTRFPHAFWVHHTAAEQAADPTRLDGSTPAVPTSAPCTSDAQKMALEAGVSCGEMHCSSVPSDAAGHVSTLDCLASQCSAPILPLVLGGTPDDLRCVSCFEANVTSLESWSSIQSKCETDVTAGFVFDGQTDTMILSRAPLAEGESFVLPSSLFRRDVLRATHASGLDVYCAHLQTVFTGSFIIYPGAYGGTQSGSQAWGGENHLQAVRAIDFMQKRSGATPLVLLGNLEASEAAVMGTTALVDANGGAGTLTLLDKASFSPGLAPGYVPACTECPENPLAQIDPPGIWTQRIYVAGLDAAAVTATVRAAEGSTIVVTTDQGTQEIPLSSHYALRSTLTLP